MQDRVYYIVEFVQKPYVKRPIADSLLKEYIQRLMVIDGNLVLHKDVFGTGNGGRIRYVHFFSSKPLYDIRVVTQAFAKAKHFDQVIKMYRKPVQNNAITTPTKNPVSDFLNTPIRL